MDAEILNIILHRKTIDTSQTTFKETMSYLNLWSNDEKKKIINYINKMRFLRKINFNRLSTYYFTYLSKVGLKRKKLTSSFSTVNKPNNTNNTSSKAKKEKKSNTTNKLSETKKESKDSSSSAAMRNKLNKILLIKSKA